MASVYNAVASDTSEFIVCTKSLRRYLFTWLLEFALFWRGFITAFRWKLIGNEVVTFPADPCKHCTGKGSKRTKKLAAARVAQQHQTSTLAPQRTRRRRAPGSKKKRKLKNKNSSLQSSPDLYRISLGDPDVVRWGLHLLDGDLSENSGYCETVTEHDTSYYAEQYVREDDYDTKHSNVENDEIIALALQEELSQLAVAEASGTSNAGEEHLQASILAQDWLGPSMRSYSSGHESRQEETDDMAPSSLCSSPEQKSYDGDDCSYPLELTDESVLDGEVGKRLNQMVPVPHVPKTNGEIPSIDEATSDHQRLLERLQLYDLVELKVQGDGNCQFRALSDQFYRTTEHHKFVRQQIVDQLKSHPEIYEGYVPMAYSDYLKKISKTGEWGDHVTLQAAADSYGIKIFVITSFKDTCYIEILPNIQKSKRVIFLSFWAEVHYNSIYPEGDLPASETKKRKRWWIFGNKN